MIAINPLTQTKCRTGLLVGSVLRPTGGGFISTINQRTNTNDNQ